MKRLRAHLELWKKDDPDKKVVVSSDWNGGTYPYLNSSIVLYCPNSSVLLRQRKDLGFHLLLVVLFIRPFLKTILKSFRV